MRLMPRSLFARTALVMVAALVVSQVVSVLLFRHYSQQPRFQLLAIGYISHLKTIRAAFETLPVDQHRDFIGKLREERGIRVIPGTRIEALGDDALEPAPNLPAIRAARERLREQFGAEADIFLFRRSPRRPPPEADKPTGMAPPLVTRLPVGSRTYWVVFPQSRVVEPDYSVAWFGWGVAGGVLALVAALFVVGRLNRPLRALARNADAIGAGKVPEPVTEMGPEEVRSVAIAFNHMQEGLLRNERERATFLAGVSHDLRTPIARLRLAMEMLPMDTKTRSEIEGDIDDLNAVIDQFMDFARGESSEPTTPTDLNGVVKAAAERAQRMGATVQCVLETHATIPLKPKAARRLVDNLLDNARKHGGGMIDVTVRRDTLATVLSIADRGPGIPVADTERLKQPFTRLDNARGGPAGAGLGLAIAERIARLHGTTLELLPRDGGGTLAQVRWPNVAMPV
jgi:two-component system osmolarity sensor histidine kinase EnvZ